jgi:hypothetical protein
MKFEREKDIRAFVGTTSGERAKLRRQAMRADPWIKVLWFLAAVLQIPLLFFSRWVVGQFMPNPPVFVYGIVFFAMGVPFGIAFAGYFITPRLRRALDIPRASTGQGAK